MPVINNATVASGAGLSTAGNGGSKLTRLQNGALISAVRSSTTSWRLLKSTDNGATWSQIVTVTEAVNDLALALKGNDIHVLISFSTTGAKHYRYNDSGVLQGSSVNVDSGQSSLGNVSLAINDAGTELHAAWSSKNATYPNSFNIRYAKGAINGDGSVTWGAAEQVTTLTTTNYDAKNPSIVIANSVPIIFWDYGTAGGILCNRKVGSSWSSNILIANAGAYVFSNPSSLFVPQSINGLANGRLWVAWHGKDATDNAKFNVRVSYSDDGGVTWATPVKLTSGNLYDRLNVSLSADKAGKVFALYEDHQWSPDIGIRMKTYNGSWGTEVGVATANTAEQYPSSLVDYSLMMTTPPFVYTDTTLGIRFSGNFNVGASLSPASGALGNKETATLTAYIVTPEAGSAVTTIVERINGTIINTFNNPASLSRTLTVPTATWDTLAYFATHTASVTVTDSNGATTVTTYSFAKTLANNASLLEATKANTDAKNRIAQKRDTLASQVGLSAGSTFDAISAQLASGTAFKKFASGTVTSGGGQLPFVYQEGSALNQYFVTVSGLNFQPKTIIVFATSNQPQTYYVEGLRWNGVAGQDTLMSQTLNYFRTTGNLYVTDSGFRLPVSNTAITYSWIAYG